MTSEDADASPPAALGRRPRQNRRQVQKFEFTPPSDDRVRQALQVVVEAGDGWVNLLPGVRADEEAAPTRPGPFAIFTNREPPVTMCTLMPPRPNRRATEGVTIGVMHPTGRRAVDRLKEAGIAVPSGWTVTQDHARRGLVVRAAPGTSDVELVDWAIAAGTCLCRMEMTGEWQAVVYLP